MMKDITDITLLLDRSGSMESIKDDTIGGINTFVREQQALPGAAMFSLVQFDSQGYERVIDRQLLSLVPPLMDFTPRSSTPLLDAMARTIDEAGTRLAALPEAERPAHVVIVTVTDGLENASTRFTREQVFAKITHQREHYHWLFVYLGANQDAIAVGSDLGIPGALAASYGLSGQNVNSAYRSLSSKVADLRRGVSASNIAFTTAERGAMDDDTTSTTTSGSSGGTTVFPTPTTTTGAKSGH